MHDIIKQQELVKLINSFFEKGYKTNDYAKLWVNYINPFINSHPDIFQKGPSESKAILLGHDKNIHLWYAPAGNIPKNEPKIIILGQATSIPALKYIMENINSNTTEQQVRTILIKSCFKGQMLGNLGIVFKYLNLKEVFISELDLNHEWSNLDETVLSIKHNPEGRLFENPLDSDIMFSQWCMHCGTALSEDTKKHTTNSTNMKKFINLYEMIFPRQNYHLIQEKFFATNNSGLLIALGETNYEQLREIYESEFPNILWISANKKVSENLSKLESLIPRKWGKFVTWIPHPSPGNLFFNRSANKKGVMESIIRIEKQLTFENSEEIIKEVSTDYIDLKRQTSQIIFLKLLFNKLGRISNNNEVIDNNKIIK
jgi:hypothetical protein